MFCVRMYMSVFVVMRVCSRICVVVVMFVSLDVYMCDLRYMCGWLYAYMYCCGYGRAFRYTCL